MSEIKYLPCGDHAITVDFGNVIEEEINDQVIALEKRILSAGIKGIVETVPTFRSLLIYYLPQVITYEMLRQKIEEFIEIEGREEKRKKRIVKIPVCYGARFGIDLYDAERLTGLTREEIINIHSGRDYRIYMLGFLPGFPYLGGLDERIQMPRLDNPRTKIPAGSVGIGGTQTGIYPMASPGGWRILGGTPLDLYDPKREQPILYESGDYIRFQPITVDEYYDIRWMIFKDNYQLEVVEEGES